jgi:hypothetical protein
VRKLPLRSQHRGIDWRHGNHRSEDLVLQAQLFVPVPQLIDLGGQLIDLVQALVQQEFKSAGVLRLHCQLAVHPKQLQLQHLDLALEFEFGTAAASGRPRWP